MDWGTSGLVYVGYLSLGGSCGSSTIRSEAAGTVDVCNVYQHRHIRFGASYLRQCLPLPSALPADNTSGIGFELGQTSCGCLSSLMRLAAVLGEV
jgi:hypothetical protein